MFNTELYQQTLQEVTAAGARLVVVSKEQSQEDVLVAHAAGQQIFGESYVQEFLDKKDELPEDIEWHMIGHVQRNKVRPLTNTVQMVHSVDSYRLLKELDKWAKEEGKVMDVLFQMHISKDDTKYGFEYDDLPLMLKTDNFKRLENVRICGLMGMATLTDDTEVIRAEFRSLKTYFDNLKMLYFGANDSFAELSMGMSNDFKIALEEGSTMLRIGSAFFTE